ncbi:MAG: SLBB domain-containing protein [Nitrospinae bacterium]|nr:SLBB domain-containing protein [Nitrospinota bacterium]
MIKPIRLTSCVSRLTSYVTALLFILIFSGSVSAQQIQMIPITPAYQLPSGFAQPLPPIQGQWPTLQQPSPQPPPAQPAPPPTRPPSVEKPSEFERYISDKILGVKSPFAVSTDIRQFGYDLFRQPPSTFAPVDNIPVGPDYVLGPGDEIRITVWGKIEGQWNVVVDRDGNVSLPKVGILGVTGLTFKELKELLHKEFSKYYTGFEMNVSMGPLRTIRIYVVGNAERPGAYTISSLSTLVNALFEAGGPSKTGTMREIQVKRNGKTIVHFDIYDFLLKGDKTKDIRLMPEDVIFIPPVGHLVAIAGSVNSPAIYELKGERTISQLIEMAGGLSDIAFKDRVQIERIVDNSRQIVFESDLAGANDMKVQSGDVVKIFQIVQDKRTVRISGAVQREGEYGVKLGMTVKDLISMAGGLKYYAYNKEAELTRVYVTDKGQELKKS